MSSNALIAVRQGDWALILNIAPVAAASRMFGVTEQQAAIVMLKGHELGLGLAASFEYIHVISGKPSVSPKGCLALIHRSGELVSLVIEDKTDQSGPTRCVVMMERTNGFKYTATFSMEDAAKANLVKPDSGWAKYPANMLRWRAIGYCADVVFPDVIGGLHRSEELGAEVDAAVVPVSPYEVVDTTSLPTAEPFVNTTVDPFSISKLCDPVVSTTLDPGDIGVRGDTGPPPVPAPVTAPLLTLFDLIEQGWTAEAIVVANEGKIPESSEECQRVKEKLEAGNVPS